MIAPFRPSDKTDARRKKVALLQAKTVANGATPAEVRAAAAKVSELTQAEQRAEAEAILVKLNWSPAQAVGIVRGLDRFPPWQKCRLEVRSISRLEFRQQSPRPDGTEDADGLPNRRPPRCLSVRRCSYLRRQDRRGGNQGLQALRREARSMTGRSHERGGGGGP